MMESGCEFPVQFEDARANGCVEETNNGVNYGGARKIKVKGTNLGHSIQCEEDLQLALHHAVAGPTSVDHANGDPNTGSLGTDRRRPILQMRVNSAHLVAQCEEDLCINTVWLHGEEQLLLGRDWWCLLCNASPWRIVLGQCEHFFCSSCYRGQQRCPICRSFI
ncbi:uncharacterized protein LOC112565809 [Pomacea canaliculata]|uniref:uncharacterized protein LOC112565809 n=1 Tax=Pomacea canaliculata TaxID=400727 RepID=UPI000D72B931|nr:uncharacterized protein LOC112565809 [Pomacea canaliculata]